MLYAIVCPDGTISGYQDSLAITAKGWRCLPVADVRPEPGPNEILIGPAVATTAEAVTRTWTAQAKTYDEKLMACRMARAAAYPPIGDQLDAAYKARTGDPAPLAAIDAAIADVKARHPKPTA